MADVRPGHILWEPSPARKERSVLARYVRWLEAHRGLRFADYEALWRWSVRDLEAFWQSIWDFFEIRASTPPTAVLAERRMPGAEWFPGAELNYAEHVFRHRTAERPALVYESELRPLGETSWAELERQVASVAATLRRMGVRPGDRVVAYMPNIPETVVAFLAAASLGATWSSCSPDFGDHSVVARFGQIEPTVLFTTDGYRYGGKDFDRRASAAAILASLPTVRHVVSVPYLDPVWTGEELKIAAGGPPLPGGEGAMRGVELSGLLPGQKSPAPPTPSCASSRSHSIIRSGCSTPPAPPAIPKRSSTATVVSSSSI